MNSICEKERKRTNKRGKNTLCWIWQFSHTSITPSTLCVCYSSLFGFTPLSISSCRSVNWWETKYIHLTIFSICSSTRFIRNMHMESKLLVHSYELCVCVCASIRTIHTHVFENNSSFEQLLWIVTTEQATSFVCLLLAWVQGFYFSWTMIIFKVSTSHSVVYSLFCLVIFRIFSKNSPFFSCKVAFVEKFLLEFTICWYS